MPTDNDGADFARIAAIVVAIGLVLGVFAALKPAAPGAPKTSDERATQRRGPAPDPTPKPPAAESPDEPLAAPQIAERALGSVVVLEYPDRGSVSLGTGFIVERGRIATNFHVVNHDGPGYVRKIQTDNRRPVISTIRADREHDLAIVEVDGLDLPPLPLASDGDVRVGETIFAIGNPLGLEGTFSEGVVSAIRGEQASDTLLQITAAVSHGSSGGPVLNRRGQVIGITMAVVEQGQNLNFAVPVSYLRALLTR